MSRTKCIFLVFISLALVGCGAQIQEYLSVHEQKNVPFEVGVGGDVYSSSRVKNLPNAFGRADIFGRTTPTGNTEVRFAGIQDGKVILVRHSVDIDTGATTMNSTPLVIPNTSQSTYSGNIGGYNYYGTTTTQAPPTVIMPNTPAAKYFDNGSIPIFIPLKSLPATIPIEGNNIEILSATPYEIKVEITSMSNQSH